LKKTALIFQSLSNYCLSMSATKPLGKLIDITATDQGLEATFKLAKTFAADDALEEAATGLRDGFSVGVKIDEWKNEDGVLMDHQSSSLQEVSHLSLIRLLSSAKVLRLQLAKHQRIPKQPLRKPQHRRTKCQKLLLKLLSQPKR
jgi:phage head maturation protease